MIIKKNTGKEHNRYSSKLFSILFYSRLRIFMKIVHESPYFYEHKQINGTWTEISSFGECYNKYSNISYIYVGVLMYYMHSIRFHMFTFFQKYIIIRSVMTGHILYSSI